MAYENVVFCGDAAGAALTAAGAGAGAGADTLYYAKAFCSFLTSSTVFPALN